MHPIAHQSRLVPTSEPIRSRMVQRGFHPCDTPAAVETFHGIAQKLIPVEIASVETLAGVQAKTNASLYLRWENQSPVAFLAFFPFSREGAFALRAGTFSGTQVQPEWVCEATPLTQFGYVWCFGAVSPAAAIAVVRAGKTVREQCFPQLGVYARAATPAGGRLMAPMGFGPVQAAPNFFYSPPFSRGGGQAPLELAS